MQIKIIDNKPYVLKNIAGWEFLIDFNNEKEGTKMIIEVLQEAAYNFPDKNSQIEQLVAYAIMYREILNIVKSKIARLKFLYAVAIIEAKRDEVAKNEAIKGLVKVY